MSESRATKVNFSMIGNAGPAYGNTEGFVARSAGGALKLEHSTVALLALDAGHRMAMGHRHHTQEETYVVVEGSGRMKLDDEITDLTRWDAIRVPARVMRGVEAGPDGLRIVVFGAPHTGLPADDAEIVPDWWKD
jgi:mannose-6-phosphate isomerase-like protein (cupin superfamily)